MDSYFYSHAFYVRRPRKVKRTYKWETDPTTGEWRRVEVPRIPKRSDHYVRMRRLFPDYDEMSKDQQLALIDWDDEVNGPS